MPLTIDALKRWNVTVFNVPRAYLQTDLPKDKCVLLILKDQFVDIMCSINPKYTAHVQIENGTKVLYLRIKKAIYRMIKSALLWYDLYVSVLEGMGFVLNPYNMCVANKTIDRKQCTVAWYVTNNKISHVEQEVIDDIVDKIGKHFPGLTISKGTEHTFLEIKIKYQDDGTVSINMKDYIQEVVNDFEEDTSKPVLRPDA